MRIFFYSLIFIFSHSKLFSQQTVKWEKSIGGEHAEYLYNAIATPDYGFLILGSSASNATGDIQKKNQGSLDYFIWKMDENGKQEWQNSFGGNGSDFLYVAKPTNDGGYILAGASTSQKSGDKTSDNKGNEDIWIIKIDAQGVLQWEKSYGGNGNDIPVDIIQTKDGGYLIASNSNSSASDSKKAEHFGGNDYYIIKMNEQGVLQWEESYGGIFEDKIKHLIEYDKGFILVGNSNSPASGNKSIDQILNAPWIVLINEKGNIISENNLNLDSENKLISFQKNEETFLFSILDINDKKIKPKIIQTDLKLNIQKTTDLDIKDNLTITEIKLIDDEFLITANQITTLEQLRSNNHSIESYYIAQSFDQNGSKIWDKKFGDKGFNYLEKAITTRDGSIILFGNSTQQVKGNKGQSDFYLVKLGKEGDNIKRVSLEVYPNPTSDFANVIINKAFNKASIEVYNLTGQHLQTKNVKYRSTPISLANYPSGIYILKIKTDNESESIKIIKK